MTVAAWVLGALVLSWSGGASSERPWHEQRYAGHTRYTPLGDSASAPLRAVSDAANSALLTPLDLDPSRVTLSWRWRVLEHPRGADPERRRADDRAAAVLVIVRRSFLPWRTRALMYQWSPARPAGEWSRSPYSGNVRTVVLRNAPADSLWREETRDLAADLARAFGEVPPRIEAIGVISDTDNTRGRAVAEFGPITVTTAER